jgi:hypothetical protein
MSRAPQKYLIQNQSGMRVYYWTDATRDGAPRSPVYCLDNGGSENLKVLPTDKRLSFVQFGSGAVGSDRLGATINLHFEGNWMPVVVRSRRCTRQPLPPAPPSGHLRCAHTLLRATPRCLHTGRRLQKSAAATAPLLLSLPPCFPSLPRVCRTWL